ncbi:uncharacterized protein ASPGLDRAFT_1356792 [Aspergillus glaucus CBS 516.65]|uniref:Uncharacterized protein n=1 Tax=Aspergillus glaucus CBS 516.65 TaxID=1160497 RepID=A0A1L9VNM4_ASPGL|nr:hypothetical protein ASPGLDRAFT_1356792 [Aspergillus glaucus CBS 516.65]OJJ85506.1 hypothetical protein ASPGLDRAFT_1356792 [Aspergillus glaucus CBS 516.65]
MVHRPRSIRFRTLLSLSLTTTTSCSDSRCLALFFCFVSIPWFCLLFFLFHILYSRFFNYLLVLHSVCRVPSFASYPATGLSSAQLLQRQLLFLPF